jgi:hypothetical protein
MFDSNGFLTMVYNSLDLLSFWTLSIVQYSKKTFRKLDLFPSSREGLGDTLLGPLERASLSHWTRD